MSLFGAVKRGLRKLTRAAKSDAKKGVRELKGFTKVRRKRGRRRH